MGAGCLSDAVQVIRQKGFKKALIVTDKPLKELGVAGRVLSLLQGAGMDGVIYDGVKPNPTTANVEAGLALLKGDQCDFVISLGGRFSPRLCQGHRPLCGQRRQNRRL